MISLLIRLCFGLIAHAGLFGLLMVVVIALIATGAIPPEAWRPPVQAALRAATALVAPTAPTDAPRIANFTDNGTSPSVSDGDSKEVPEDHSRSGKSTPQALTAPSPRVDKPDRRPRSTYFSALDELSAESPNRLPTERGQP